MHQGLKSLLVSFARRRRGATAVEFAFIIGPFLALLFGVIEVSIAHMNNSKLQTATQRIVRLVETGEGRCMPPAEVFTRFCTELEVANATQCDQDVRLAVMELDDMLAAGDLNFSQVGNAYNPGRGGDRMGIQGFQKKRAFFPYLGALLGVDTSQSSQTLVMQATYIFKNEPFNSNTPCNS